MQIQSKLVIYCDTAMSLSLSLSLSLQSCWKSHLVVQMSINKALLCSCPIYGCHARPTRAFFVSVFGEDSETIAKVR